VFRVVLDDFSRANRIQSIFQEDIFFSHLFLGVLGDAQGFPFDLLKEPLKRCV